MLPTIVARSPNLSTSGIQLAFFLVRSRTKSRFWVHSALLLATKSWS